MAGEKCLFYIPYADSWSSKACSRMQSCLPNLCSFYEVNEIEWVTGYTKLAPDTKRMDALPKSGEQGRWEDPSSSIGRTTSSRKGPPIKQYPVPLRRVKIKPQGYRNLLDQQTYLTQRWLLTSPHCLSFLNHVGVPCETQYREAFMLNDLCSSGP